MFRYARRIIIFLLLGAVVNVLVAWGCEYCCKITSGEIGMTLDFGERNWPRHYDVSIDPPQYVDDLTGFGVRFEYYYGSYEEVSPNRIVWDKRPGISVSQMRYSAGFPMYSLDRVLIDGPEETSYEGLELRSSHRPPGAIRFGRAFSSRPIWPGFLVNTLFYTAILWLIFALLFGIRSRLRLRSRRCPHCNYPFGESPTCTECGRDVARWITTSRAGTP